MTAYFGGSFLPSFSQTEVLTLIILSTFQLSLTLFLRSTLSLFLFHFSHLTHTPYTYPLVPLFQISKVPLVLHLSPLFHSLTPLLLDTYFMEGKRGHIFFPF